MGIHERDPCRLTWAISGDFRLVVLGILLYSCVLRTKTRSKIAPWQVQRSFDRRICAKAMKSPQTIRRLLARALKMHRCKSVGQNRHVSLPCMPRKRSAARMLSLRPDKRSRRDGGHAPPQRHLERSAATTKEGVNGGKRAGERSERESVVPRQKKEGSTGRKRVKRKRLPVVVPVKIKIPVASADMRRHSDTLRGAQRRRKRGLRGENRISVSEFCCLPVLICLPVRQHLTQRPQSAPNTPH